MHICMLLELWNRLLWWHIINYKANMLLPAKNSLSMLSCWCSFPQFYIFNVIYYCIVPPLHISSCFDILDAFRVLCLEMLIFLQMFSKLSAARFLYISLALRISAEPFYVVSENNAGKVTPQVTLCYADLLISEWLHRHL